VKLLISGGFEGPREESGGIRTQFIILRQKGYKGRFRGESVQRVKTCAGNKRKYKSYQLACEPTGRNHPEDAEGGSCHGNMDGAIQEGGKHLMVKVTREEITWRDPSQSELTSRPHRVECLQGSSRLLGGRGISKTSMGGPTSQRGKEPKR